MRPIHDTFLRPEDEPLFAEQLQSEDYTRLWVIYYIVIAFAVLFGIAIGVGGTLVVVLP